MGCDVHTHIEVKPIDDDEWVLFDQPQANRNYDLFERMAGVRGEVENALVSPRGLPDDASKGTMIDYTYADTDTHTPSWLSYSEIQLLNKWYDEQGYKRSFEQDFGYLFGNGYNLTEYSEPLPISDVRMVFWFDN